MNAMNAIEAIRSQSEFVPDPHLVITVDGTPLDTLLADAFPQRKLNGLVPTLLDWIDDDRERQIVWQRILPADEHRSIAPILMCPDDLDFQCSIVVAEILSTRDAIQWHRLGIDQSETERMPDGIGSKVDWLSGFGPFTFDRTSYNQMLDTFRHAPEANTTA